MIELRKYNENGPDAFTYGVEIVKRTTGTTYNINAFVDELNIWESLFAKSMQCSLLITDSAGLIDTAAIQPGDRVHVVLYQGVENKHKIDKVFDIMSMGAGAQTTNKQGRVYTLSCVTAPATYNKISVVNKALSGKISDMVKDVAKTYLRIEDVEVEETDGDKKSVVAPGKKPFRMLDWLGMQAVSVENGVDNSLYFFYEDRDGFRFLTAKKIISRATTHEYTMTGDSGRTKDKDDIYRILNWQQNRNGSNASRLDNGMIENEMMEFDIKNRSITSSKFSFKDRHGAIALLASNPVVDVKNELEGLEQLAVKAKGVLAALRVRGNDAAYGETNTYARKHSAMLAQKNAMNQVSYSFGFGGNSAVKAGDLIDVNAKDLSAKEQKEMDMMLNGKFLIGNVRHQVLAAKQYNTTVDVFKDGYDTAYTEKK